MQIIPAIHLKYKFYTTKIMKAIKQLKTMITGLVLMMVIMFTGQKVHSQFLGLSYADSTDGCINLPTEGFIHWNALAGPYTTGDSIDFAVDWGDGNITSYPNIQMFVGSNAQASTPTSHVYSTSGVFIIHITATDEFSTVFNYTDSILVNNDCGFVSGIVRLDDGDNIYEFTDQLASSVPIIVTTNLSNYGGYSGTGFYTITNIDHSATTYSIEVDPAWLTANGFTVVSPASGNYSFTTPPVSWSSYDFLLDCGASYSDASVSGYGWGFRPGMSDGNISIHLGNFTCDGTPANVDLSVDFDPMLTVGYINIPGYVITGNTITASISNISNYTSYQVYFTVPPGTPASTPLVFDLDIDVTNYTDMEPINNHYVINSEVRNSWDPNDKSTNVGPTIDANTTEEIFYNIRFQNMGNDYAYDIHIVDTIDSQLDLSTFQLETMSHQGSYSLDPITRIIVFNFPNIMLPWQTMSDPLSQGYVRYSIKENVGLPIGSEINNTACIYFDTNPAIITNTTSNTNATVGIEEVSKNPLFIYPQPANERFFISGVNKEEIINVYFMDINGKTINMMNGNNIDQGIQVSELPNGIYIVSVNTTKTTLQQKLIINH